MRKNVKLKFLNSLSVRELSLIYQHLTNEKPASCNKDELVNLLSSYSLVELTVSLSYINAY